MNTLLKARSGAHGTVRAAVLASVLAVAGCFGAAVALAGTPLEAAQPQAVVAAE